MRHAALIVTLLLARSLSAAPCGATELRDVLRQRGQAVQAVTDDGRGGAFFFVGAGPEPEAVAWAGRLPGGQLISSRLAVAPGADDAERATPALRALFATLDDPGVKSCELLAVGPDGRADASALLDGLRRALGGSRDPQQGASALGAPALVNALALAALLGLLGLLGVQGWRGARRNPRLALQLVALAAAALLVRVLSAARQPVGTANGDLTHVLHAASWLSQGFGQDLGPAYPPAYRVLLSLVFALTGPSLAVAFWMTTILGALVAVPAALIARRLSPHPAAGALAGLALATYPPSVLFSNGVDLSVPAGLLLTLAFERLLAAREEADGLAVATSALALWLFVQCRLEALGVAALALPGFAALLVEPAPGRALRRLALTGLLGLLASIPYLASLSGHAADLVKADDAGRLVLLGATAVAALALAGLAAGRLASRRPSLVLVVPPLAVAGTLAFLHFVLDCHRGNPFVAEPSVVPELPFVRYHVDQGPWRFLDHRGHRPPWLEPGVFPFPLLALLGLSLFPTAAPGRRRPLAPLVLLALPVAAWLVSSRSMTGIVLAEGLRLHSAYAGLVAASLGLGAARALEWFEGRVARWTLTALLAAVLVSPLATHRGLLTDGDRNPQAELRFAERAMALLPVQATLVLPDDRVDMSREGLGHARVVDVFRGDHLWRALAATTGHRLRVVGLSAFRALPLPSDDPVFVYLGLDCARTRRPAAQNPSCDELRSLVRGDPTLDQTVPNRELASLGLPWFGVYTPEVRLTLLPLTPSEVASLRRAAGSLLVNPAAEHL